MGLEPSGEQIYPLPGRNPEKYAEQMPIPRNAAGNRASAAAARNGLVEAVRALVFTQNWADVRRTIDAHPALLSDMCTELFDLAIEQLREVGNLTGVRRYEQFRDLLVLARQIGVDDAIADMVGEDLSPELRAAVAPLAEPSTAGGLGPEQRIGLIRRALELAGPEETPRTWGSLHGLLGEALLDDRTGDRGQNAEDALDAFRKALSRLSKASQPVLWAVTMNNLARAHTEQTRGDPDDHHAQARAALRQAVEVFIDEAGPRILAVETERMLLALAGGTPADLRRAIDLLRRTLVFVDATVTAGHPADLPRLAQLLDDVVRVSTDDEDAGELPEDMRTDDPVWDRAVGGMVLLTEYLRTGEVDTLWRALHRLEDAARSTDASHPRRGDVLAALGSALWSYHGRVHDPTARDQGTTAHRQAVALLPPGSLPHVACLAALAGDLAQRHQETGERGDLDEAIDLMGQAASSLPDAPQDAALLRQLGDYRLARHSAYGDPADLDTGLDALRAAEALIPPDAAGRFRVLTALSSALVVRYGRQGDLADLEEALTHGREALGLASDRSGARFVLLRELGRNLTSRYERTRRPADLDEAVQYSREALALSPATVSVRAELLLHLGLALNLRHDLRQQSDDLTDCIELVQQAVDLCPPGTAFRDVTLNMLSGVLRDRYFRTGDMADLAQSIDLSHEALRLAPPGTLRRPHLVNLGVALRQRYARSGELSDLDEAIAQWREAYDISSTDTAGLPSERLSVLIGLSVALLDRHRHTRDGGHLQEAVDRVREAWALASSSTGVDVNIANCLATTLLNRYWQDGDPHDLDEAELVLRRAADADQSSVHGQMFLPSTLARVLGHRYDNAVAGGEPADPDEARSLFRRAVTAGLAANPELARVDSQVWGEWAARRNSWREAAEAYGYGLQAMERLFRAQLTRTTKELRLRDVQGLAVAAAYALAKSGDAVSAAVALERGRALILSEALERSRARLEQLASIGRADLSERFRRSSTALAALEHRALAQANRPGMVLPPSAAAPVAAPEADLTDALRTARTQLDAVVADIRQVPAFEQFLDPPGFDDVRAAATTPLVYLAAAEQGGYALMVADDRVEVCWLPSLTAVSLRAQVETYLRAYRARASDPVAWVGVLDATTRWLWNVVMEPVVTALAPADRAALVPAGLLGLLPLHAAWREDVTAPSGRRYALDDLLLTYTPNARARVAAAEQARAAAHDGLLAVDDPRPVAAGPLPAAGREVQEALKHFTRARRLDGGRATLRAVEDALGDHPILHFACHGFADVAEPLASGLMLAHDQSLTLRDLLRHGSLSARLAVLSACETAVPGTELPDEVVNLPTGLLQAGVAGVVGSLWSVSDTSTMALMARFYELWRSDGLDPPEALRRAQQWVRDAPNGAKRDRYPDVEELSGNRVPTKARRLWEQLRAHRSPSYWAAFVYVGE